MKSEYTSQRRPPTSGFRLLTSILLIKHQLLHLLFVVLFIFQIEHSSKNMIPDSGAYSETLVFVLVMMKMMISPKSFHPFEWRVPCMNSIVHSAIHEITEKKSREEHKSILATDQKHDTENDRCKNKTWHWRHKETLFIAGIMMMIAMKDIGELL